MPARSRTTEYLYRIYADLHLDEGLLLEPAASPTDETSAYWQAIGDWLSLAERMNADRVFFVGNDPVLVFAAMPDSASERDIIQTYRLAWSLARPQCLFLATIDELRVYDLSMPPPTTSDEWRQQPFQVLQRTADVAEALTDFRRDQVESGRIFSESHFGNVDRRADKQLISDVNIIAKRLREANLAPGLAHGLIERVILIRYLEDRKVITRDYLLDIARHHEDWIEVEAGSEVPSIFGASSLFAQCLRSKALTYDIFRRLAAEFNGDLFLVDEVEVDQVTSDHLDLIFRLLTEIRMRFSRNYFSGRMILV